MLYECSAITKFIFKKKFEVCKIFALLVEYEVLIIYYFTFEIINKMGNPSNGPVAVTWLNIFFLHPKASLGVVETFVTVFPYRL